jgi:hypothetical protein
MSDTLKWNDHFDLAKSAPGYEVSADGTKATLRADIAYMTVQGKQAITPTSTEGKKIRFEARILEESA